MPTLWRPPERIKHNLPESNWPSAARAQKSKLFQPIAIGEKIAQQRTVVPAMVPWRASPDGEVTPAVIQWYHRFAQGRPGILVVEATGIRDVPSGPLLRIGQDRYIPGLRKIVHAVKEASNGETLVLIQLIDFLRIRRRRAKVEYLQRFLQITPQHREKLRQLYNHHRAEKLDDQAVRDILASVCEDTLTNILSSQEHESLLYGERERIDDLHLPHIRELPHVLPDLFARAASRAYQAGFDGVELHFAHAYTMASFLSAHNQRTDGFGGPPVNRIKAPLQVLRRVRDTVGKNSIVGIRYLGDEVIQGGSSKQDIHYFATCFAQAGVDYLSVSTGGKFEDAAQPKIGDPAYPYTGRSGYECMPTVYSDSRGPFGRNTPTASQIRSALRAAGYHTPVITAGGICTFEQAEAILETQQADLIAAARQSLADPDWFLKIRTGRGEQIRRCTYTNYCEALDQQHLPVTCKLWDRQQLEEPDVPLDSTGTRRLVAP